MGLNDARLIATSLEPRVDLSFNSPAISLECLSQLEISHYHKAIGSLMYAAIAACADISFMVSTLLHFMEEHRLTHWKAILQVFKYLKGTQDFRLVPGGNHTTLKGYSNADWASHSDQYSISGYAFFIGNKQFPGAARNSLSSPYGALSPSMLPLPISVRR